MSDQENSSVQSTQTPEELRQRMLDQINASKSAVEELSDEELEEVAGGGWKQYAMSAVAGIFGAPLLSGLFGGGGSSSSAGAGAGAGAGATGTATATGTTTGTATGH